MLSSQAIEVGDSPMHVAIVPKVEMNASTSSTVQTGLRGAVTMATVQIPQMRVLQAIATKPTQLQTTNFQTQLQVQQQTQPQQIQFLKAVTASGGAELLLPSTTIAGIKTAFTSPGKGGPTVVTIPGARMVTPTNIPAKLKVGDTIVIPTKTLNTMNASCSTPGQPVVIKHESIGQVVFSTPTKVMPNASSKSPMIASPATPIQSGQMKYGVAQQPGTPVSQAHPSPMRLATISPSSWQASPLRYKRPGEFGDHDMYPDSVKKTRRTPSTHDKGSKGLRHFAMLVCEKVKQKGTTTYNEVADELVSEYSTAQRHMNDQYDQKNIRRRVYDALNVLMAMNIIYKDKKDIHWVGLPTNSAQEMQALQTEKQKREQRIQHKTAQLHELILQQIAFKNLVQRNKRLQQSQGPPASNSAIQLPFIIVNTSKKTVIDCSISNDKYEYLFNFDNTFEIHDDIEVLKRMGMAYGLEKGSCSKEDLRTAQTLVPPVLKPYLEEMAGFKKVFNTFSTSLSGVGKSFNSNMASLNASNNNNSNMLDGGLLLAAMKPDPNDQEVAMVVDQDSLNSESQGSSSSLTMTGPSSSSRGSSADPLSAMHSGATSSSPNLDVPLLSPGNFDT